MESFYLDRPLNFAHRGASHEAPENTLAAFVRATELGADGIEFDVQLSRDGWPVIIHDFGLDKTTSGTGLVRNRSLSELKDLDAGEWFDPAFSGERIPTLQEVFDVVGQRLLMNVELKTASLRDDRLAAVVAALLEENDLVDQVIVSSFNPLAVRRAKRRNQRLAVGLLYAPDMPFPLQRPWLRRWLQLEALHPHHSVVDSSYVQWAKAQGYRIHTWTVDDPEEIRRVVGAGADIIISNRPDLLGKQIEAGQGA